MERATKEARLTAQRVAVERVATEAGESNAAEAQRRVAAATMAKENQQKTENDIESFFNMGFRPSSAPKQRNPSIEAGLDAQFQNKVSGGFQRTSPSSSVTMRKTHSTTNTADDLDSNFEEVEGESEERIRARLEWHQRILERATKALAKKNGQDLQVHRDQAERDVTVQAMDETLGRMVTRVVVPRVVMHARHRYGDFINNFTSLELEDGGGCGTSGSHWEKRFLMNEIMTGSVDIGYIVSKMTMALL